MVLILAFGCNKETKPQKREDRANVGLLKRHENNLIETEKGYFGFDVPENTKFPLGITVELITTTDYAGKPVQFIEIGG